MKDKTIKWRYIPKTKDKWRAYFKIFLPIIFGSMLFALNGVIDNFMVGHIDQGQASLGAVNTWTGIIIGFFLGTAAIGSIIMAQFYHAGNYKTFQEVSRIRFLFSLTFAIIFAIIAWSNGDLLISVFLAKPKSTLAVDINAYNSAFHGAQEYIKVIAIQWILISLTFNFGNQLREIGRARVSMFWGMGSLTINIILNSIFMFVMKMGVVGAAWASVSARILPLVVSYVYIHKKKLPINLNLFKLLAISKETWKQYFKRSIYGISIFTVTFFIMFRNYFYSKGYPSGEFFLGKGVTGIGIVSLTGALINVFTVVFNALSSMAANFVGSELGKGNLKQAKLNSDELKGFNTLNAMALSTLLAIFGAFVPFMSFLSASDPNKTDNLANLIQVSHSIFVIAAFFPMWVWFTTSYRNANAGGKGHWFALADWITGGPLQLGWLAIVVFGIAPNVELCQYEFAFTYFLFFLSDFSKLLIQEILYVKYHWLNQMTNEESECKKARAADDVAIENISQEH